MFLEMTNVKSVEYSATVPESVSGESWVSSQEDETTVFVSAQRDDKLMGEGIMRDLARRVQALRKEMGFLSTDILDSAHIAELDEESRTLLEPYLEEAIRAALEPTGELAAKRRQQALSWMWQLIDAELRLRFPRHRGVQQELSALTGSVERGEVTAFAAAHALLEHLKR